MDLPIEKVITKVDEAALQPAVDRAMAFVEREKQYVTSGLLRIFDKPAVNVLSRFRRLVDGVLPLTLRGLVGSMQKAERTEYVLVKAVSYLEDVNVLSLMSCCFCFFCSLVDYEPFKMPVDDKEYRGKVFRLVLQEKG